MREISADNALDLAASGGTLLVCFARDFDLPTVTKVLKRFARKTPISVVRVEPTEDAAKTLQLIKYPTFLLYQDGNEKGSCVGTDALFDLLESIFG